MSSRQWVRDAIEAGLVSDRCDRGKRSWLRGGQIGGEVTVVICEVVQSSSMRHRTCPVMMRTTDGSLVRKADRVGVGWRSDRCHSLRLNFREACAKPLCQDLRLVSNAPMELPSLRQLRVASRLIRAVSGIANLPASISRAIDKSSIRRFLEKQGSMHLRDVARVLPKRRTT